MGGSIQQLRNQKTNPSAEERRVEAEAPHVMPLTSWIILFLDFIFSTVFVYYIYTSSIIYATNLTLRTKIGTYL